MTLPCEKRMTLAETRMVHETWKRILAEGRDGSAREDLEAMGHDPRSPLSAARLKCRECMGGALGEIEKCSAPECPLWPFRSGKNPWVDPMELSDEERERRRERARALSSRRADVEPTCVEPQDASEGAGQG